MFLFIYIYIYIHIYIYIYIYILTFNGATRPLRFRHDRHLGAGK